jgi:hypothetical protein
LSGVHPKKTEGADVSAGKSADQFAADVLGRDTLLASIEVAATPVETLLGQCDAGYTCIYTNTVAWRTPTTPLPTVNNPRVIFERLFGDGGTTAQRLDRLQRNRSILDWLVTDVRELQRTLGSQDRSEVSQYLDSIREIETRIQKAEQQSAAAVDQSSTLERPLGIPGTYSEHVTVIYDLLVMAFRADVTRVFTFLTGREQTPQGFPEIGIPESHHAVSHHRADASAIARYAKINTLQTELFAKFLVQMGRTPDGDGTLLDKTLLLYGGAMSDGNLHSHFQLPLLLAGGADVTGGRHVVCTDRTPMTNLLVSMLQKADVPIERLGDSTGVVEPLSGI